MWDAFQIFGSEIEILAVVTWLNLGTWALSAGRIILGKNYTDQSLWLRVLVECVVLLPPQAALFLYPSSVLYVFGIGLFVNCALTLMVIYVRAKRGRLIAHEFLPGGEPKDVYAEIGRKPYFTNMRATIMTLCSLGVVMAGTEPFPRHFLKRRDFSASLMDVGTGCVVTTFGMTLSRMFLDASVPGYAKGQPPVRPTLFGTLRATAILFAIGLVRFASVALGAPSEATEYGLHWNFFMTLAALPLPIYTIMRWTPAALALPLGVIIAAVHQTVLTTTGMDQAVLGTLTRRDIGPLSAEGFIPRTFFELNRKGIVALPGYIALQLIAMGIAAEVFTRKTAAQHRRLLAKWAVVVCAFAVLYAVLDIALGLRPSRTVANAPYILFVACIVTLSGAAHLFVDLFVQLPDRPVATEFMESVNYNQLLFFLAVNIVTGLLNTINASILHVASRTLSVTLGILGVCVFGAVALRRHRCCLRL